MPTIIKGSSGGGSFGDVQVFDTVGTHTWTKPAGAKMVFVYCQSGGGGGGGGGCGTSDSGGGSGAAGAVVYQHFLADMLNDTEDVIIGAGGAGGAGRSTQGNGNPG